MVTPGARCGGLAVALMTGVLAAGPAQALEGYFQHGYGARSNGLGGAGVADGRDATTTVLNPAGLVNAQDEADLAFGVFSPTREFDGSGAPGLTPTGSVDSGRHWFPVPNSAFSYHLAPNPTSTSSGCPSTATAPTPITPTFRAPTASTAARASIATARPASTCSNTS